MVNKKNLKRYAEKPSTAKMSAFIMVLENQYWSKKLCFKAFNMKFSLKGYLSYFDDISILNGSFRLIFLHIWAVLQLYKVYCNCRRRREV